MAKSRIPGPVGLNLSKALGLEPHSTEGGAFPGPIGVIPGPIGVIPAPIGLQLWQEDPTALPPAGSASSKPKALIIIGAGQDGITKGVRFNNDTYFDKAAFASFAAYTASHDVTLRHVDSAQKMKELIESGTWDVVIYFGHGVENQMALDPHERGKPLTEKELAQALQKAQAKNVYLFGCKAGDTGLARQLSKDVPGATVRATFGTLEANWKQGKDPHGSFTNEFDFKEPLTEYTGGFRTENGQKTKQRRRERGDPIRASDDPFSDTVDQ